MSIDFEKYMQMARVEDAFAESTSPIRSAETYRKDILGLYASGYKRGLSTGWRSMDEYFTVRHGEMTVITGIPGHGKSSWLDNVMISLSRREHWKWAVFSAENFPVARHIAGLAEIYTGLPFGKGPSTRMTPADLDLSIKWIDEHFSFIPPGDNMSLNRIIEIAADSDTLDALVIDPWNELDHARPEMLREDQYISIALSKLRWLARNADIHIFVVAHPAKYIRQNGQPKPIITLNEVKGASEWFAKADNGLSVWRDETDTTGATDVHIQKIRFREVGRAGGAVRLYYDRVSGRYTDPNHKPTIDDYLSRIEREPGDELF